VRYFVEESFSAVHAVTEADRPRLKRVWLLLNVCSLDAPIVAVLWQFLFEKCLNARSTFEVSAALALSVWLIYVSDRLLDAQPWRSGALAPRHEFCRRYWHALATLVMAGLFILGWLCGRIDPRILRNGLILLSGVVCYLGVVHLGSAKVRKLWPKELVVGTIFSFGTCLPVWTLNADARPEMILPAALFALLCTLNCMTIEFREWAGYQASYQSPINASPHRLSLWIGTRLTPVSALLSIVSAICFVVAPELIRPFFACCLLSSAGLCSLAWRSDRIRVELSPVLSDAALFTPVLALAVLAGR
jgi:hypothetical protein